MRRSYNFLLKLSLALGVLLAVLLVYLDAMVSTSFSERRWEVPARVYARPLELFPGRPLRASQLDFELELLGYREVAAVRASGQKHAAGNRIDLHTRGFRFPDDTEPARRVTVRFDGERVEDIRAGGRSLDLLRLEPVQIGGIYPRHREDRLLLRLEEVPRSLQQALLAVEDRRFYQHWGISPTGIARAAYANFQAGRVVQGGSTITQQLVKNYYLTRERSYLRKLAEVLMAVMLELHAGKDEILEGYINEVYLGQDGPRAIHGFGLAARHYFDSELESLGYHQQALLVGMVKGPSLYNPLRHPQRALERRNTVLDVMYEQGLLNDAEYRVARAMPLGLSQRPRIMNSFPAYLDIVRRELRRDYREEDLGSLGLSIFTGFDPLLQQQAEQSIAQVMDTLDTAGELETALVVASFDNGELRALIGGRQPRFAGFNRAVDAVRPVGSLLKPVVYLSALQQPGRWTLATLIDDSPLRVEIPGQPDWEPRNFDRTSHGAVPLYQALAQSYNQATARLGLEVGVDRIRKNLDELGVEREQPAVPSMILGAGGMSPLDIARLYQTIASGGFQLPLHTIRDVLDAEGRVLKRFPLEYERVASLQAIHLLHYALRDAVEVGTGKSLQRYLPRDFTVAGKTGTTNGNRDSWFAGFSGDLLTVSWVGRDDNGKTGLTGATGALRIWGHFMSRASRVPLAYRTPEGIDHYWIDEQTGRLSAQHCAGARLVPFIAGSQPTVTAPCHREENPVIEWFRELF